MSDVFVEIHFNKLVHASPIVEVIGSGSAPNELVHVGLYNESDTKGPLFYGIRLNVTQSTCVNPEAEARARLRQIDLVD